MAIRVGVVGLGTMGAGHLKAWRGVPSAEVVAVCDIQQDRREGDLSKSLGNIDTGGAVVQDFSRIGRFASFAAMLRRADLDVVDICTPSDLHARMALAALKAGKHVFCEKPMALSFRQAAKVAQAAEQGGRMLMIGHVLRFWPEYVWMKEAIDSKRYGKVLSARFCRYGSSPGWSSWFSDGKRSGSSVLYLHIHDADTVQWFFGPPARVASQGVPSAGGGFDQISTQYHYPDVPMVQADGGWLIGSYPFWMGATITLESAVVEYHSRRSPTLAVYNGASKTPEHPAVPKASGYRLEIEYFAQCVADGSRPARILPHDSARVLAILEAEMKSARTGRPVNVTYRERSVP